MSLVELIFNDELGLRLLFFIKYFQFLLSFINFNKDIDCFSTSSIELFSLASSYNAKEYLLAVVAEKLLFLLNFNSLF